MGRHHNQGMTTPTLQGAVRLQDLGVVRALGSDAATFLHGQLTNDILSLDSRQARLAGYCSAKGRLLASFVVWRRGIDELLLACSADLLAPALPALDMAAWHWLEVRSGVPRIVAATLEQFVPQMVNLELVGGVNFQKGCYPGQEIVARSQYRGTVKRRAFLYDAADSLQPGQEVYAGDDPAQPSGMVVNAASLDGGRHAALVEVKIAAADGALHAGSAQGPLLQRAALPYPIPAEAA
jgi:folate-binding protein YgfZ